MSKTDQRPRLATGRGLAYDEHGAADGTPIFYFHGSPSTRLEWHLFGSDALRRKLRVRNARCSGRRTEQLALLKICGPLPKASPAGAVS
jgi:hypothetical protein